MPKFIHIDGSALTLAFLQRVSSEDNFATYTFASQNLGTASADRRIVVGVRGNAAGGGTVSSATIGGVSATIHINNGAANGSTATISAIVPSGTTGDIIITWSTTQNECGIVAYSIKGETSATPEFALSDLTTPLDITPTILGNTAVIAHSACRHPSIGIECDWAGSLGVIEDTDSLFASSVHSSASLLTSGSGNITATYTDGVTPFALHVIGWK